MTVNDRAASENSKKPGSLYIVNQLFKIYFELNKISLCRNIIRAIEIQEKSTTFEKRDMVTYQYYIGRISLYEDKYTRAEACLAKAWRHCHKGYRGNKRRILQFLVPVKMILGVMPSQELMDEYDLEEYKAMTTAVLHGDVHTFNQVRS
jgi:hypothetical protein